MGYYTFHELEVIGKHGDDLSEIIEKLIGFSIEAKYSLDLDGSCIDQTKWYNHEEEMKELSMMYPEELFRLSGKGEEYDDFWIEYYKKGKVQVCKGTIEYEKFNEDKLS